YGTVKSVERGSRDAEQRRAADRVAVTTGLATSVRDWLQTGQTEASALARNVNGASVSNVSAAMDAFLAQPRTFTRKAIVFSGSTVIAGSGRFAALTGLQPHACVLGGQ